MAKYYVFYHNFGSFVLDGNFKTIDASFNFTDKDKILLINSEFKDKFEFSHYTDIVGRTRDYNFVFNVLDGAINKNNFDYDRIRNLAITETKEKIKSSISYDTLLIQAINAIDEINKSANLLSKRLREWFSHFLPEISDKISAHEKYVKLVRSLSKEELLTKYSVANSMGADFSDMDYQKVVSLADSLDNLYMLKENYTKYVSDLIQKICPNCAYHIGDMICARLISLAGGFSKLARYPASTIQLLGAEKSFFRYLKNKNQKNPKYGVVYQHALMSKVKASKRGKLARILGNFAFLAFKVDLNNPVLDEEKVNILAKSLKRFANENELEL